MEHYLVESSQTGETFLVKWYTESNPRRRKERVEWDHFHVLRLDKEGNAVYAKDLGGVCIFLSNAEPFCLPEACLHDQRPNCIYYLSKHHVGIKCMDDEEYMTGGSKTFPSSYWFPPKLDSGIWVFNSLNIHSIYVRFLYIWDFSLVFLFFYEQEESLKPYKTFYIFGTLDAVIKQNNLKSEGSPALPPLVKFWSLILKTWV